MRRSATETSTTAGLNSLCSLTVILSSDCNLRCAYCFENAKQPGRMPWPVLRRALSLLLASSRRRVSVVFTGGEPTLEFGLIRRATRYIEAHAHTGLHVGLHLATNGTLLDRPRARFLAEHGFHVQVSLDGVAKAQSLRSQGTWFPLDALLTRLRREHARWFRNRLSVAVTLHPRTIPFFADSIDYLLAKDVRDIRVDPVCGLRRRWHPKGISDIEAQLGRAASLCRHHFKRTGRVPVDLFKRRPSRRESAAPSDQLCGVGSPQYVAVDVDGEVSGCVALVRSYQRFPDTRLGHSLAALHRGSIGSRDLRNELAESATGLQQTGLVGNRHDKYSSYDRCAACRYSAECSVCPVSIVWKPGNRDPNRIPDFECAFNRVAARLRRRFRTQH